MGTRLSGARTAFPVPDDRSQCRYQRLLHKRAALVVEQETEPCCTVLWFWWIRVLVIYGHGTRQAGESRGAVLVEALRRRSVWM